jgi:predicted dehydrogenase
VAGTRTLRAGIIGCGDVAQKGHVPALRAAGVEVVAVCDAKPERAAKLAHKMGIQRAFHDYGQLLAEPDIDLVSIGLPNALHAPVAIAALGRGKHVLCEKPMATRADEACAMAEAARRAGRLLGVNQHMRFEPTAVALREAVTTGALGQVYLADLRLVRQSGIPGYGSWFTRRDLAGGGVLFDLGVHQLDLAMFVLGFPRVVQVSGGVSHALGQQRIGLGGWGIDRQGDGRFDVEDTAWATLTTDTGTQIRLHTGWAAFGPEEERVTLYGTCGGADRAPHLYGRRRPLRLYRAGPRGAIEARAPAIDCAADVAWLRSVAAFVAAVRGEAPPAVPVEQSLVVMRILEQIRDSATAMREPRP